MNNDNLIKRLEAGEPTRELFVEVSRAIHPHLVPARRFEQLLDAEAWTDAALMLLPDGYDWIAGNVNGHVGGTPYASVGSNEQHHANHPANALAIAAIREGKS